METSTKLNFIHLKKKIASHIQSLGFISPYFLGLLVFVFIYARLCTNDSNLDGDAYFTQGEYQAALECYNEYLMLHPNHIKTLYNRGRCFDELGDSEKAAVDYEAVLDLDPNNIKALVSLSQFYFKKENYNATINLTSGAIMLDSGNYLAHYYKARACHRILDIPDALESYNAAIDLNPDFGLAYLQRGSLLISLGWPPFGCHDLQVAASLNVEGAEEALQKYCR